MRVYLSGPMTGVPDWNYPAFHKAAARLRELGHTVLNPAETAGGETKIPRAVFMSIDTGYVRASEAIVVMEGWKASKGAKFEVILASIFEIPVFEYDPQLGVGQQLIVSDFGIQFGYFDWRAAMGALREAVEVEAEETEPQIPAETEDGAKIIPLFSKTPTEVS